MDRMTAGQMLGRVDALLPNQYGREEKMQWLAQAEGFVLREAEAPYDELYRHYVEAQIHYANGEMARYNNAAAQWNNAFLTYKDYRCRRERPQRGAAALRLF